MTSCHGGEGRRGTYIAFLWKEGLVTDQAHHEDPPMILWAAFFVAQGPTLEFQLVGDVLMIEAIDLVLLDLELNLGCVVVQVEEEFGI